MATSVLIACSAAGSHLSSSDALSFIMIEAARCERASASSCDMLDLVVSLCQIRQVQRARTGCALTVSSAEDERRVLSLGTKSLGEVLAESVSRVAASMLDSAAYISHSVDSSASGSCLALASSDMMCSREASSPTLAPLTRSQRRLAVMASIALPPSVSRGERKMVRKASAAASLIEVSLLHTSSSIFLMLCCATSIWKG